MEPLSSKDPSTTRGIGGGENWSIFFNRKRTPLSYIRLFKLVVVKVLVSIPFRLTASQRKLPDFLIIGVAKGGTTSLFSYLSQHPQIEMSRENEIHYFAKYYKKGINYYRSFFPFEKSNKLTGESSPYYFFHPQVPQRIKKDLPNTKIILLLRDPVTRAHSHYEMMKGVDWVNSFDEAVTIENERVNLHHDRMKTDPEFKHNHHQAFSYIKRGFYYDQLQNWLKFYRLEELLILKSEEFFADPKKTLSRVYSYLEIDEIYPQDLTPQNTRSYNRLSKVDYDRYKKLFEEDGKKLVELLGQNFKW